MTESQTYAVAVKHGSAWQDKPFVACLLAFVLLMMPFCFLGYGPDNDTYQVLDAGRAVWMHHVLQTSRNPGYWTYEALVFVLSRIGGFVLTNFATLAVSAVLLWRFYVMCGRLGVRFRLLLMACLAALPVYVIASTTTMDYLWSMLGLIIMVECLIADRWGWATAAATFCYLIRSANCLLIAGVVAGGMIAEYLVHRRLTARALKILGVGCVTAVVGSLPFIASYRAAGNSMEFAAGMAGPAEMWTPKMRVGRFVYKGILLFSLPGWLVLVGAFFLPKPPAEAVPVEIAAYRQRAVPLLLGGILMNVVLFFKYSIEVSYLLPGVAFLLLVLGINILAKRQSVVLVFLAILVLANVVNLRLASPNMPGHSTGAKLNPGLVRGELIEDTQARWDLRHCETLDCWNHIVHPELYTPSESVRPNQ